MYAVALGFLVALTLYNRFSHAPQTSPSTPPDLSAPNPLPSSSETTLENLTWLEVRDKVREGYTRVIIPTGGIEQNGPFVALNKHDLVVKHLSSEIAHALTHTLVAPVVSFVPEGEISPPTGHMQYPGTISLTEETFVPLLEDIGASLGSHGFQDIIILGDSGQSQAGMKEASERLSRRLKPLGGRAVFVPEFYDYDAVRAYLRARGIVEQPEQFHEELAFSLQLLAIAPDSIHYTQRLAAGNTKLGGVSLLDREALTQLGRDVIAHRVAATVAAIQRHLTAPSHSG